ncbi:aminotransferase class I/II-fold pyridoxal phosphate-dependent enzyme [Klebsiella pneumoniae]|uniref:MalY/PatB family protein n=1 Tax=Klebsiella pneumoniae TaxID=573 RepID=UPI001647C229|nr:pyridoxal phosphate-dependent aminotransferase [Klebsiella pneumoniae]
MFDFATPIDRHGTWCTQWDYVADRFGAADLLPFTISDMDFATAPCILDAVSQRLAHGVFGYSRWRNEAFLGAIAHWYASRFNSDIDPQSVVYGPSVIYMVAETIRQWSKEGDGVVVHTPAYDAFYNTITANRRRIAPVPLILKDNRWRCDMDRLEAALAEPKNTLLLLCSPHNPTGKVWRREELETMAALCQKHGVRVISDEIHMDMTWSEHRHIPWSEVAQGPWALFTSGSKSFNIPAFTGAYGFIPEENERDSYLQANMRYVADTLNNAFPALGWQPPEATYLAWIDLRPLNVDDRALQQALIAEQKVAIMPGYTYGPEGNGFLRLNVGCPREKLERGVEGLIAALRSLS